MGRNANCHRCLTLVLLAVLVTAIAPARLALADDGQSPSTVQIVFDGSANGSSAASVHEAFRDPKVSRVVVVDKALARAMPAEASSLLFTIRNVRENGLLTSVSRCSVVDGKPLMTVRMSQFKGPRNSYACDAPVPVSLVSAAVGFDVTAIESLNVAAEAGVPMTVGRRGVHPCGSPQLLSMVTILMMFAFDRIALSQVRQGGWWASASRGTFPSGLMTRCCVIRA